jgi:hypothetical protein
MEWYVLATVIVLSLSSIGALILAGTQTVVRYTWTYALTAITVNTFEMVVILELAQR